MTTPNHCPHMAERFKGWKNPPTWAICWFCLFGGKKPPRDYHRNY